VTAVDSLPELSEEMTRTIATANRVLLSIEQQQVPQKVAATFARADSVLHGMETKMAQLDVKGLSSEARATLDNMNQAMVKVNSVLARMDGDQGFIASAQHASNSVGVFAETGFGPEWGETLRDLGDAAASLRRVLDQLERDPDMLLKGRSKEEQ
jgi:hypothetical protein